MSIEYAVVERRALVTGWRWRPANGRAPMLPAGMDTRHLFNTLKMIWNNRMPSYARVGETVRLYAFGASHPDDYLKQAIYELAWELGKRSDLTPYEVSVLDQMAAHLDRKPELLA